MILIWKLFLGFIFLITCLGIILGLIQISPVDNGEEDYD